MAPSSARTILITGCSSGIGLDAARTLRGAGWRVFATCRAEADCMRLRDEGLESLALDYESADSVATAAAAVLDLSGGTLDALFHNGAYAIPGPLEDIPRAGMEAAFSANFIGWHDLTARILPRMRRAGHGRIVFNSSVLGFVPALYRGAYVATKFAVEGYADTLRLETRGTGIHVSILQPGPVATPFRANAIKQFERWVDWQASDRADEYRDRLLDLLYKGSGGARFEVGPAAVTARLRHALESQHPRARYPVTVPTRAMSVLTRILPRSLLDRICARA